MPRIDHAAFETEDPDGVAARVLGARVVKANGRRGRRLARTGHGIGVGLLSEDPDGRLVEAITYRAGDDPRRA